MSICVAFENGFVSISTVRHDFNKLMYTPVGNRSSSTQQPAKALTRLRSGRCNTRWGSGAHTLRALRSCALSRWVLMAQWSQQSDCVTLQHVRRAVDCGRSSSSSSSSSPSVYDRVLSWLRSVIGCWALLSFRLTLVCFFFRVSSLFLWCGSGYWFRGCLLWNVT